MIKGYTFKATAVGMAVGVAVTLASHSYVCQEHRWGAWSDQPDSPRNRRTVQLYGPPVIVIASSVISGSEGPARSKIQRYRCAPVCEIIALVAADISQVAAMDLHDNCVGRLLGCALALGLTTALNCWAHGSK